jgi:hypothetical protein
VDAPPDARSVDGNYAGVVRHDGTFQHLNLKRVASHRDRTDGYPPIAFDVRVEPGQTITYRANIR